MTPLDLPLAGQPGSILVVHPDDAVRHSISELLPADWVVNFAHDDQTAQRVLRIDESFRVAHRFFKSELLTQASQGRDLAPAIMRFWAKYTERFGTTCSCIASARLYHASGAAWPRDPRNWDGARVLIGSKNDAAPPADAVVGEDHLDDLASVVATAVSVAERRLELGWIEALGANLVRRLAPASRQEALRHELRIWGQDYVVLSEPFGALALFRDGVVRWFAFGEQHAEPAMPAGVDFVKEQSWRPLGDDEFGASLWILSCDGGPSASTCYDTWLSMQPRRRVWN